MAVSGLTNSLTAYRRRRINAPACMCGGPSSCRVLENNRRGPGMPAGRGQQAKALRGDSIGSSYVNHLSAS